MNSKPIRNVLVLAMAAALMMAGGCTDSTAMQAAGDNAVLQTRYVMIVDLGEVTDQQLANNAAANLASWRAFGGLKWYQVPSPGTRGFIKRQAAWADGVGGLIESGQATRRDLDAAARTNARAWRDLDRMLNGKKARYDAAREPVTPSAPPVLETQPDGPPGITTNFSPIIVIR